MALDARAISLPVLNALRRALEQISVVTSQKEVFQDFLTCFGWDVSITETQLEAIRNFINVEGTLSAFGELSVALESGSENELQISGELLSGIINLITSIKQWRSGNIASLPSPFDGSTTFWDDFSDDMLNQMVVMALRQEAPALHHVLVIFGVFEQEMVNPRGAQRIPFIRQKVYWNRLDDLVTDPLSLLKQSFKWGQSGEDLNYTKLIYSLGFLIESAGFPGRLSSPAASLLDIYYSSTNPIRSRIQELDVPFLLEVDPGFQSFAEIGVRVLPISPVANNDAAPNGIMIAPLARGSLQGSSDNNSEWALSLVGDALLDGAFRLEIRPNDAVLVLAPGETSLNVGLNLQGRFKNPFILIGTARSHRIEIEGLFFAVEIKGTQNSPEVILKTGTGEGANSPRIRFILQASEGDSFLQDLLGSEPQSVDLAGYLSFSSQHGIGINGSIGFQLQFPLHLALGPIDIQSLQLGTRANDSGGADIPIGINVKAALGPLTAVVEDIGAAMVLTPLNNTDSGLLGNLDVDWIFKPPNGVGLALDAGIVEGGGFLRFDPDKEQYDGILELNLKGIVSVKAIGLITTRLPDGSKGFSLLIIITAEFGTGLQLGFGFVLLGVGGLLGLNRTMKLQPLTEGVRTGATESILFPQNIIANAPRIISDLRRFFPPEDGIFLVGPMAKLGWGTPALITLSLGIIFEIPGNIAILGVLKVVLPDERAALLVLQVNFIGAIEFDKQRVYFFATLFESRILFNTIEGGMGVLMAWGDDSNFVVSVGGFHPQFTPPPLPFPTPQRIAFTVVNQPLSRIRVMAYFAVTSNTVQFGARAEIFFGFSKFKLEGHLAFDALFQFSPFFFIIEISCEVSLKVFGIGLFSISLKFSLEGPTPWRAKGYGKLKLLFFTIKANFDYTWGEEKDTSLPPIEVLPLLQAEFEKLSNWKAQLPASSNLLVSLRMLSDSSDRLVMHPVGTLTVTQRAVPLDLRLDKVGNQKPSDGKRFYLDVASGLKKVADLDEQFAIAQFQDFKDAEKLSQAPFQPEEAGIEVAVSDQSFAAGKAVKRNIRYETHIIDTNFQFAFIALFGFVNRLFNHFLNGSVVTKSVVSQHYKRQFQPFDDTIVLKSEQFVVASTVDNRAISQQAVFTSEAKARDFMDAEVARDASRRELLHVIPSDEVNVEG
ncbi:MAG: DUF6603 domain-containing protein [Elainellaceae cyanobacterium]